MSTAWSYQRAYHSRSRTLHGIVRHTQSGYVGTKPSENATSRASCAVASLVSSATRSIVASRSKKTGVACTAAIVAVSIVGDVRAGLGYHQGPGRALVAVIR